MFQVDNASGSRGASGVIVLIRETIARRVLNSQFSYIEANSKARTQPRRTGRYVIGVVDDGSTTNDEWSTENSKMEASAPHPMLGRMPRCRFCNTTTERRTISPYNRNGNAGRPMYECGQCGEFACFGDMRGVQESNPMCDCEGDVRTRVVVSGPRTGRLNWRTIYYVCAVGECYYLEQVTADSGEVMAIPGEGLDAKTAKAMGL